jgi:hypothetical protein
VCKVLIEMTSTGGGKLLVESIVAKMDLQWVSNSHQFSQINISVALFKKEGGGGGGGGVDARN